MLKSIISFSILFVSLSLAAPTAQATQANNPNELCGKPTKTSVWTTPAAGHWLRLLPAHKQAAKEAGMSTMEYLFGDEATNVVRFNRKEAKFAYPGALWCVPIPTPGNVAWTPMPARYARGQVIPRLLVISRTEQFMGIYSYGKLGESYPVSTGKPGKETPLGVFFITRKHKNHKSSLYMKKGKPWPMPYAALFTVVDGGAVALHEGTLPGHPDSHACVRLMQGNAKRVFSLDEVLDPIIVTNKL